jgi:hypothetical protein
MPCSPKVGGHEPSENSCNSILSWGCKTKVLVQQLSPLKGFSTAIRITKKEDKRIKENLLLILVFDSLNVSVKLWSSGQLLYIKNAVYIPACNIICNT